MSDQAIVLIVFMVLAVVVMVGVMWIVESDKGYQCRLYVVWVLMDSGE